MIYRQKQRNGQLLSHKNDFFLNCRYHFVFNIEIHYISISNDNDKYIFVKIRFLLESYNNTENKNSKLSAISRQTQNCFFSQHKKCEFQNSNVPSKCNQVLKSLEQNEGIYLKARSRRENTFLSNDRSGLMHFAAFNPKLQLQNHCKD